MILEGLCASIRAGGSVYSVRLEPESDLLIIGRDDGESRVIIPRQAWIVLDRMIESWSLLKTVRKEPIDERREAKAPPEGAG